MVAKALTEFFNIIERDTVTSEGPINTCFKNVLYAHQAVRLERPFTAFFPKVKINKKYI